MFKHAKQNSTELCNGIGQGVPFIDNEFIIFNGSESLDQDYETCEISKNDTGFIFCKTASMPYDKYVVAIYMYIESLGYAQFDSDGMINSIIEDESTMQGFDIFNAIQKVIQQ